MVTDMTMEEARLLDDTNEDFFETGKTEIKCPRCGGRIIMVEQGASYTIGCENNCIQLGYRGI